MARDQTAGLLGASRVRALRDVGLLMVCSAFALSAVLPISSAQAAQIDIVGPAGSVRFGASVTALSNGNIVVIDPDGPVSGVGAAYLYSPAGVLISTLTGSSSNDHVGSGGVRELSNGNYLILSPDWNNGAQQRAGAVTWASASSGVSGVVSATNSLVGSKTDDQVGVIDGLFFGGITLLSNGNYVVVSSNWDNGAFANVGAVTWGNGATGTSGVVSPSNSLIGSSVDDRTGSNQAIPLSNGHYVVVSPFWNDPGNPFGGTDVGAVTWVNGNSGLAGLVASSNSMIGASANDMVGLGDGFGPTGVTALRNGHYVIASYNWHNSGGIAVGAITWVNGSSSQQGTVTSANSLIGSVAEDTYFPSSGGVVALSNGNYVVSSPLWNNGASADAGAVTFGNGGSGTVGVISASNSLVGTATNNNVGGDGVVALSNGHYVVCSPRWDNGVVADVGAATFGNGSTGISGILSPANSLIGSSANDRVGGNSNGSARVHALANGNYVVASPFWNNGAVADVGAVTWASGTTGRLGTVSPANSLIGASASDFVGNRVEPLTSGHYVVASSAWDGVNANVGAVTFGNGISGLTGVVSTANSLVGSQVDDRVGEGIAALADGGYVVSSRFWNNGGIADAGAATWAGANGLTGIVSAANSLVGTTAGDEVGAFASSLGPDHQALLSSRWDRGVLVNAGAVTLARNDGGVVGNIIGNNSVRGSVSNPSSASLPFDFDPARAQLVVGRPASNLVSLFTLPAGLPFVSGFE